MRKVSFTVIFSLLFFISGYPQDLAGIKKFADTQLAEGNYASALKEYQRLLFFDSNNEYQQTYTQIAVLFYKTNDFNNALKYFDFALKTEQNDSLKYEIYLSKAMCNFRTENYMEALTVLLDLPNTDSKNLLRKKNLFLGTCYYGINDYKNACENFILASDSTDTERVKTIFSDFEKFRHKYRPEKVELMSMLLPGLGQIYTGHTLNGLNSTALLSGVTFYAYKMFINYGTFDGLLVLSSWFYRYYTGGFTNARNFAIYKTEAEKNAVFSKLIQISETREPKSTE